MRETLKEVLIKRDGITPEQADAKINKAKKALKDLLADGDLDGAMSICETQFGLEPDYIDEIM